ncbi:MAG: VOC family protein [Thiotrichales bacterium]
MHPILSYITLGVLDFDRALTFYRDGLKFPLRKLSDDSNHRFAFFELGGNTLALYPHELLAAAAGLAFDGATTAPTRVSLSLNVASASEVAEWLARARDAGGQIRRAPYSPAWGGTCAFFTDPDGHLWEVVSHPRQPGTPTKNCDAV